MVRLGHADVVHLLMQLGIMLIMGRLFAEIARKFKQPAVIGEIIAESRPMISMMPSCIRR